MLPPKPYREERPWGEFTEYSHNTPSTVKVITVKPGQALSLQRHHQRDEFWHVLSGDGSALIGEEKIPLKPGDDHFVPREIAHRLEAGDVPLVVLEISFGQFEEDDIVRLEDRYGRTEKPN